MPEANGFNSATRFETKRLFDGADNFTGIGVPFNGAMAAWRTGWAIAPEMTMLRPAVSTSR